MEEESALRFESAPKNTLRQLQIIAILFIAAGIGMTSYVTTTTQTNLYSKAAQEPARPLLPKTTTTTKMHFSQNNNVGFDYDPAAWSIQESQNAGLTTVHIQSADDPHAHRIDITAYPIHLTGIDTTGPEDSRLSQFADFVTQEFFSDPLYTDVIVTPHEVQVGNYASLKILSHYKVFDSETENVHYVFVTPVNGYLVTIYNSSNAKFQKSAAEILGTITFPDLVNVQGATDTNDRAPQEIAALVQPAIVRVLNKGCSTLTILDRSVSFYGKQYPFCGASTGSGFFLNKNGYIGTNGHVISQTQEDLIRGGIASGSLKPFLLDTLELYFQFNGLSVSRDKLGDLLDKAQENPNFIVTTEQAIQKLLDDGDGKLSDTTAEIFVQLGKEAFKLDKDMKITETESIVKAELIDKDYEEMKEGDEGFRSSDVALLKVKDGEYPALLLADSSSVKVLAPIIVVGYPGVATDIKNLITTQSAVEATFTTGAITSIKEAAGDEKRLFQTDAAVSYGNSGGPGIDSNGQVIGVATYALGITDSGSNYNFLRDISDLEALMTKHTVTNDVRGKPNELWAKGLTQFWKSQYKSSVKTFNKLAQVYPSHNVVERYTTEAQEKINAGEDKSPLIDGDFVTVLTTVSAVLMFLGGIALLLVTIVRKKSKSLLPKLGLRR